ncbi:MAG: VOC family protein [Chloroflexi bacterium]|nr:VOC family protein [Chloroflexota bacterium]
MASKLYDVAYLLVPVTDLERAVRFYRDGLGLDLLWYEARQGHAAVRTSAAPLVLRAGGAPNPAGSGPIIAFEVEDIQAAVPALEQQGVTFPEGIERHGGRLTARFADPDGNPLELNQTLPPPTVTG